MSIFVEEQTLRKKYKKTFKKGLTFTFGSGIVYEHSRE